MTRNTISLMQDDFMVKLVKNYNINITGKLPKIPLPAKDLKPYNGKNEEYRTHLYRQEVRSICYPALIMRPDIAKAGSKLAKFLINPGSEYLKAADHCIKYLYNTRNLGIQYTALGGGKLII